MWKRPEPWCHQDKFFKNTNKQGQVWDRAQGSITNPIKEGAPADEAPPRPTLSFCPSTNTVHLWGDGPKAKQQEKKKVIIRKGWAQQEGALRTGPCSTAALFQKRWPGNSELGSRPKWLVAGYSERDWGQYCASRNEDRLPVQHGCHWPHLATEIWSS